MNAVLEQISKIGIVPVVKIDRAEDALPLAKALCAGGLPCAEVTFRTGAAAAAIKAMTVNFPQMCVGAGTVLNAAPYSMAKCAKTSIFCIKGHGSDSRHVVFNPYSKLDIIVFIPHRLNFYLFFLIASFY